MKRKIIIAICYDFDGTLAPGNMHEHSLLPSWNINKKNFWSKVKEQAKNYNMNEILSYMYLTLEESNRKEQKITRDAFRKHGEEITLFNGVQDYFEEINNYANSKGCKIEHYIISSGLKEIIEGNSISKNFKYIFASEFYYDVNKVAKWPANAIDYTGKTQYLFRINKGTLDVWDNSKINKYVPDNERRIPFKRMVYIGDGETDIPAMKMINFKEGYSIAVYDPNKRHSKNKKSPKEICEELIKHKRATYMAPADYSKDKPLIKIIKKIIDKISLESELEKHTRINKSRGQ